MSSTGRVDELVLCEHWTSCYSRALWEDELSVNDVADIPEVAYLVESARVTADPAVRDEDKFKRFLSMSSDVFLFIIVFANGFSRSPLCSSSMNDSLLHVLLS